MKNIILSLISASFLFAGGAVGVSIKVKGDVVIVSKDGNQPSKLIPGNPLHDRDVIRTGEGGFAASMYLDDRTIIKITENTEYVIGGTRTPDGIDKSIAMNYGTLHASVAKQEGKEFLISTPTSVASVKGTDFTVISDPEFGDSFLIFTGVVEVTNSVTGEVSEVNEGETAVSTPEGELEVEETVVENIPVIEDEEPQGETEESEVPEALETHIIIFEMQNENGDVKEVRIEYR